MKNTEKTKDDYIQDDLDTIFNMSEELTEHFSNLNDNLWNEDIKKDFKNILMISNRVCCLNGLHY